MTASSGKYSRGGSLRRRRRPRRPRHHPPPPSDPRRPGPPDPHGPGPPYPRPHPRCPSYVGRHALPLGPGPRPQPQPWQSGRKCKFATCTLKTYCTTQLLYYYSLSADNQLPRSYQLLLIYFIIYLLLVCIYSTILSDLYSTILSAVYYSTILSSVHINIHYLFIHNGKEKSTQTRKKNSKKLRKM